MIDASVFCCQCISPNLILLSEIRYKWLLTIWGYIIIMSTDLMLTSERNWIWCPNWVSWPLNPYSYTIFTLNSLIPGSEREILEQCTVSEIALWLLRILYFIRSSTSDLKRTPDCQFDSMIKLAGPKKPIGWH